MLCFYCIVTDLPQLTVVVFSDQRPIGCYWKTDIPDEQTVKVVYTQKTTDGCISECYRNGATFAVISMQV